MSSRFKLPGCIKAERRGHWSMGSENHYDINGELAPITWACNCGSWIKLETLDESGYQYISTPQARLEEFLSKHSNCPVR